MIVQTVFLSARASCIHAAAMSVVRRTMIRVNVTSRLSVRPDNIAVGAGPNRTSVAAALPVGRHPILYISVRSPKSSPRPQEHT